MAREVGNTTLANQELALALQADPNNATALREMGALMLTQENYELARRFYVRAVQADPADKTAQGYLGCTLMRLNRASEATNFLNRAGPGPWSQLHAGAAAERSRRVALRVSSPGNPLARWHGSCWDWLSFADTDGQRLIPVDPARANS